MEDKIPIVLIRSIRYKDRSDDPVKPIPPGTVLHLSGPVAAEYIANQKAVKYFGKVGHMQIDPAFGAKGKAPAAPKAAERVNPEDFKRDELVAQAEEAGIDIPANATKAEIAAFLNKGK